MLPESPVNLKTRMTVLYTVIAVSIILILSCGRVSRKASSNIDILTSQKEQRSPGMEQERRRDRNSIALSRTLSKEERFEASNGYILLQTEGKGFYHYDGSDHPYTDAWGMSDTIACIEKLGEAWEDRYPNRARIGVGDISRRKGGKFPPHHTHRLGMDVDIRPVSKLGEEKVSIGQTTYDRVQTTELIELILEICDVELIYFNDRKINRKIVKVKHFKGHHNHIHITLKAASRTPIQPPETPSDIQSQQLLNHDATP
jgi:penicillin-insensitive murein endopeptidase